MEGMVGVGRIIIISLVVALMSCTKKNIPTLKIAVPFELNKTPYDPARVEITQDANIVRTLYSNLLEYDANGKLILGLADSYEVNGNKVTFKLGVKGIFSNGDKITGKDVEVTFLRLLNSNRGTHSSIKNLLCGASSNAQPPTCSGIKSTSNEISFEVNSPESVEMLINAITSHDLRIIPFKALDKDLNIADETVTSGLYSITSKDFVKNEMNCKINENHFRYNKLNPPSLTFKYIEYLKEFEALESGVVDLIPTFYTTSYRIFKEMKNNYSTYETEPIKLIHVVFDKRAFEEMTAKDRITYGLKIKNMSLDAFPSYRLYKPATEYFPNFSEASLSQKDDEEIKELYNKQNLYVSSKKFIFRTDQEAIELFENAKEKDKNIVFQLNTKLYENLKKEELPHAFFQSVDTAFYDTESVMLYALKRDKFSFGTENQAYIDRLSNKSKEERIKVIKEIHKRILEEGRIVPIAHAPYFAIANKKWKLEFSKYFAGSPVWGITYQGD